MKRPFLIFAVCEIAYVVSVRLLRHNFDGGLFQQELYWSAIRVISICILVWLYRRQASRHSMRPIQLSPRFLFASGMFLAPIFFGDMGPLSSARYLFASTSILVAVREELAYRGIFQAALARRFGIVPALVFSNLVFVAYHLGLGPFQLHFFLQVFLCGTILGIIYHLSGSILLAIAFHTVFDVIDSFAPYSVPRLPDYYCTVILGATLGALLLATKRPNSESCVTQQPSHDSG
jgi:membrane protease YdiL (CAAX protease family)